VLRETGHLDVIEADFIGFALDKRIAELYEYSWHEKNINGIDVNDFDKAIDNWYSRNEALKSRLYSVYKEHYTKAILSIETFNKMYEDQNGSRQCFYCDITEKQILELRQSKLIKTKRNRGKMMEIDRLNSNMEYSEGNIVLACYYCNNAKTDEFSNEEFMSVGEQIRKIWINRLSEINGV
jgi:hypothetical protein